MHDSDTLPDIDREMGQIAADQPAASAVGQGQKAQIIGIGALQGPRLGFIQHQTVSDEKLQPKRWKPMGLKLWSTEYLAIFTGNGRTNNRPHQALQNPVHDDPARRARRIDAGGDHHIGVENHQSHATGVFRQAVRPRLISWLICSSVMVSRPASRARRQLSRRLALARARRRA